MPNADMDEPKRANDRKLREDPRCTKSKTESDEPKRPIPYTAKAEPNRQKLRTDTVLPKEIQSTTDRELPSFDTP
jgi:hypothetical protein